jgi:hypothetical protein
LERCCAATFFGFHDHLQFNVQPFKLKPQSARATAIPFYYYKYYQKLLPTRAIIYNESNQRAPGRIGRTTTAQTFCPDAPSHHGSSRRPLSSTNLSNLPISRHNEILMALSFQPEAHRLIVSFNNPAPVQHLK